MKKLLTIATVAAALSGLSALGQGYFLFTGSAKTEWTGWLNGTPQIGAVQAGSNNVAFLIGTGTPLVDGLEASTATNAVQNLTTLFGMTGGTNVTAWYDILNDPDYSLATYNTGGTRVILAPNASNGAIGTGTEVEVNGTSSAGGTISIYVIGWSAAYATPQAAALAGSPVGWSAPFSYTYANSIGTPLNFTQSGLGNYMVDPAPIPEPTTLALAGLGGLSLLLFRRRLS